MHRSRQTNPARRLTGSAGFTLIELLIVVAIILIIAAIAIPNYMHSRMVANEAAAVENLRTVTTAETIYHTTYLAGYSLLLADLGGAGGSPNAAGLIDDVLASGTKSGFIYTYTATNPDPLGRPQGFTFTANPVSYGTTGQRYFYTDQSGVIRQNSSMPATVNDPPL